MKILSKGNTTWKKEFTCKACKAKLEVSKEDLVVKNFAVFYAGETWEPEVCFVCPVCHTTNKVSNAVPAGICSKLYDDARSD